jgi:hypothetical protein
MSDLSNGNPNAEEICGLESEETTGAEADWIADSVLADRPWDSLRDVTAQWDPEGLVIRFPRASLQAAPSPNFEGDDTSFLGISKVPADLVSGGYNRFRIRTDLVSSYQAVYARVKALGGVLTSIGGLRELSAKVTVGRSRTSLHYTGRAIDLYTKTGMQPTPGQYVVTRDGGSNQRPLWKIYCVVGTANPLHSLYDETLISERELPEVLWKKGTGAVVTSRKVRCFCLTDVLAAEGWLRIPARLGWQDDYLCCEWWHFQSQAGLTVGQSSFGEELRRIWGAKAVASCGLQLNAVWRGQAFQAPPQQDSPVLAAETSASAVET